jgi:hypothetical protein
MDMDYNYAVEYYDSNSVCTQWATVQGDSIADAVRNFKIDNPNSRVYNVFVEHTDAQDYYEEF